jgi:hypothetical protein
MQRRCSYLSYKLCKNNRTKFAWNNQPMEYVWKTIVLRGPWSLRWHFCQNGGVQNIIRITKNACVQSPITRTLFLLKHVAGIHIRSTHPDFPLSPTQLEIIWITQAQLQPIINLQICHHFLNKLLLYHITNLSQLTLPNRIHLMTYAEFQTYHHKPPENYS